VDPQRSCHRSALFTIALSPPRTADVHVGFALLGSTVLLPLFTADPAGALYRQHSGLALLPGGFSLMLLMPLVGSCSPVTMPADDDGGAAGAFLRPF